MGLTGLGDGVGDRQAIDAGHRRDRLAAVDAVGDEHRVDEVGGLEAGLADQAAERVAGAEATQAGLGKRHGSRYRPDTRPGAQTRPQGSTRQEVTSSA